MVSPISLSGYNADGDLIVQGTAESAANYIDPQEIRAAAENLKNVMAEQMANISRELSQISEDATEAVVIQGTKMSGTIDDTREIINQLPNQILGGIEDLGEIAQAAYDNLQNQYNNQLYNQIASYAGVVRIG